MDKNFLDVVNNNLSVSLKKVNIINVKRSFTIDNYYDIDNTIIYPISCVELFCKLCTCYIAKVRKSYF